MSWFYNWQFAKVFRENHESCRIGNGAAGFHLIIKEVFRYEDDISAKEEIQSQGSWVPCQNEHSWRQKGSVRKKSKRKKSVIRLGRRNVAFSFYMEKYAYRV